MRAETLTQQNLPAIETEKAVPAKRTRLLEQLNHFLGNGFESDWEKKVGVPWKEWCTWGQFQKLNGEKESRD